MTKISGEILKRFVDQGFFDVPKSLNDVVRKFSVAGFSIPSSKFGLVAQLLTYMCQEGVLERSEIPKEQWVQSGGRWTYKKVK